jgi:hypothetical protein
MMMIGEHPGQRRGQHKVRLTTQWGGSNDDEKLAEGNNGGSEDINDGVEMTAK